MMDAARTEWRRWCIADPCLAVVPELDDLPDWMRGASGLDKEVVMRCLAALTEYEVGAVTSIAWLLIPGGRVMATELRDLSTDIDGLVAGLLWAECCEAWRVRGSGMAHTLLMRTRREVCAELGVGDGAKRRDFAWAMAVPVAHMEDRVAADLGEEAPDPFWDVTELMIEAMDAGAIEVFDAWLIGELARGAHAADAPGHRGRLGLTTPAVVETVGQDVHLSTRALRRRATKAIDRIAEYVDVRDDPPRFAVWKAQHPAGGLTAGEQMHLVIGEDYSPHWIRARSQAAAESVLGEQLAH